MENSLPTANMGEEIAAIAADIVDRGRHPDDAARWATCYRDWSDVVSLLGYSEAARKLVKAAHAAQAERWAREND